MNQNRDARRQECNFLFCFNAVFTEIDSLVTHIRNCCRIAGFEPHESIKIELAIVEAANNKIEHACMEDMNSVINFFMKIKEDKVMFFLSDTCSPFDGQTGHDIHANAEDTLKTRYFGLQIINSVMDRVEYVTENGVNTMIMTKLRKPA